MHSAFYFILVMLTLVVLSPAAPPQQLRIIAGAESHGMIDACECEIDPGGGMGKRATLLASLGTAESRLLLDAGGFSAGGIYDDYSEGRSADSLRSGKMLAAMGLLKYDAVAIGDDDLQYGGALLAAQAQQENVPLVCANCYIAPDKLLAAPFLIVEKAGMKIGVTAVTTRERLFPVDPLVSITEPAPALRLIWKEMVDRSDVQVLLSHLGQEETAALVKLFPECDLAVNGHRKTDKAPLVMMGPVPCMQFGFQGKSLAGALLARTGKQIALVNARWHDVTPELSDNPAMTALLKRNIAAPVAENEYDLYIMSQCPYGLEALKEFVAFAADMPSVRWRLWFIGSVDDDTLFSSLHGSGEVYDEKLWLAIRDVYPSKWTDFLRQRAEARGPTGEILGKLGMDVAKINEYAARSGNRALQEHYRRSTRLSVDASPTLMINNRPFGRTITVANLRRFQCSSMPVKSSLCSSLPECSEDIDCRAPGKLGSCEPGGKCRFHDAVPFDFTVLIADSTLDHPEKKVIATTTDLFPGADVRIVKYGSSQGKKIVQQFAPAAFPFYLFGSEVGVAHNFSKVSEGLIGRSGAYTFKNGIVPLNYHFKRNKTPGTITVYIDPFFTDLPAILSIVCADSQLIRKVAIMPVVYQDPSAVRPGTEERFRQEEALRWIVLGAISKAAFHQYLAAYAKQPGGSNWPHMLDGTGIAADFLIARVAASGDRITTLWKTVESLDLRSPVTLLLDNIETVQVSGERELRRILSKRIR